MFFVKAEQILDHTGALSEIMLMMETWQHGAYLKKQDLLEGGFPSLMNLFRVTS